jgi:hypothetical protein
MQSKEHRTMKKHTLFAALVAGSLMTLGLSAQAQYAPRQDLDRDGIQNRHDADRDGDGIRNAQDPNPNVKNVIRRDNHARNDRYGPYGDLDRDGIQNRVDRDRDGDGVPNFRDRRPDDRRYS